MAVAGHVSSRHVTCKHAAAKSLFAKAAEGRMQQLRAQDRRRTGDCTRPSASIQGLAWRAASQLHLQVPLLKQSSTLTPQQKLHSNVTPAGPASPPAPRLRVQQPAAPHCDPPLPSTGRQWAPPPRLHDAFGKLDHWAFRRATKCSRANNSAAAALHSSTARGCHPIQRGRPDECVRAYLLPPWPPLPGPPGAEQLPPDLAELSGCAPPAGASTFEHGVSLQGTVAQQIAGLHRKHSPAPSNGCWAIKTTRNTA